MEKEEEVVEEKKMEDEEEEERRRTNLLDGSKDHGPLRPHPRVVRLGRDETLFMEPLQRTA